jgi:hypothetical protein
VPYEIAQYVGGGHWADKTDSFETPEQLLEIPWVKRDRLGVGFIRLAIDRLQEYPGWLVLEAQAPHYPDEKPTRYVIGAFLQKMPWEFKLPGELEDVSYKTVPRLI